MKNFKHQITALMAGFIYASLGLVPAYADDTEIYFGGSFIAAAEETRPNIMFVLDTSGSMAYSLSGRRDGSNERLDALKQAMTSILSSTSNVNMGIMRFTIPGGPVLHRVAYIDELAVGGVTRVNAHISNSGNDATELVVAGTVKLDDPVLELGARLDNRTNKEVTASNSSDLATQYVASGSMLNSSCPQLIDRYSNCDSSSGSVQDSLVGVRFRSLGIPAGRIVSSASISLGIDDQQDGGAGEDDRNLSVTIAAESADSGTFNFNSNNNISNRQKTQSKVDWLIDTNPEASDYLVTPDLSPIVQELVDKNDWTDKSAATFIVSKHPDSDGGRREIRKTDENGRPTLRVEYGTGYTPQAVGLRFAKVDIPSKAPIVSARLEFTAASSSSDTANFSVFAELSGNSEGFVAQQNNLQTRKDLEVAWNNVEPWVEGSTYSSPDLTDLVQEVVKHNDWCGGNAMSFVLSGSSGSGRRSAVAYDQAAGSAPRLVVEYDASAIPEDGGCASVQRSVQINSKNDDAEQKTDSGNVSRNDEALNLSSNNRYVGLRFNGVPVPQGATITSVQLEIKANKSDNSAKFKIQAQDVDDASEFRTDNSDISERTKTSASVEWQANSWSKGQIYLSPELNTLVQEVVKRPGWASGNSLALILERTSGNRSFRSFDKSPGDAPRLHISYTTDNFSVEQVTVRQKLQSIVDNEIIASGNTPIVETYHEAALYMRGDPVKYGKNRNGRNTRVSVSDSWTGGTLERPAGCTDANLSDSACANEKITGNPVYTSPIEYSCQQNHIVLLTDGEPTGANASISDIQSLIGKNCSSSYGTSYKCGEELAEFLATEDQKSGVGNFAGKQTINTHTIALVGGQSAWLEQIAIKGGGGYYPINSDGDVVAELTSAFNSIIGSVLDVDTSFAAPAVAISRFNRLIHRNEIYYAVFKPLETPNWPGNLKKFGLSTAAEIVDVNGNLAVEFASGAFKSTSTSYWSTAADGNDVLSGGAASVMPAPADRKIYTYHETSSSKDMTANDNLLKADNSEITKSMLDIGTATDQERTNLINWIRGVDVKDEDGNPTTDARFAIGDPLHSRPIVVTYKTDPNGDGDPSDDEYYIFFGTNAGMLHAINGSTGVEKFALVPDELLKNFKTFYENRDGVQRPYGLDGEPTIWVRDIDNDGNIEVDDGDRVYLYVGMRRGGRSYFAYDITDINTPKFLWKIEGGSGNFGELGQSWSKPLLTTVRYKVGNDAVNKTVLFFAGGYDLRQDDASVRTPDGMGRAVYMVDAVTGELLWEAKKGATGNAENVEKMIYSIPTQLAGADLNGDGVLDTLFYGDMGGQIFRTDFDSTGTKTLAEFSSTALIATVADDTAEGARRFYHAPDIALTRNGTDLYLTVVIGSGYRAHPLDTTIVDRFYAIKQPIFTPGSNVNLTENDLYDATENEVQVGEDPTDEEVAAAAAAKAALKTAKGWYITMENTGEKVLSRPTVIEGTILFTTYEPAAGVVGCTPVAGQNRSYLVNIMDASAVINRDNIDGLDKRDRSALLNVLGIVGEGTLVTTGEKSELKCGTQDCGLVLDGANTVRTFWFQQE